MFQFPGLPSCTYGFSTECMDMTPYGFSHSDICESMPACGSSQLFAAYHVLLRLLVPRHPPYALIRLTFFFLGPPSLIYCDIDNTWLFLPSCPLAFLASLVSRLEIVSYLFLSRKTFPLFLLCSFQRTFSLLPFRTMEINGFEPLTPCLQGRCSPS